MQIKGKKQLLPGIAVVLAALLLLNVAAVKSVSAAGGDIYYTCPMPEHADVVADKPGKCPKCGMTLVEKKKEQAAKYICPMAEDSDVVMDKPGKCPKCGMNLIPKCTDHKH